MAVEEVDEEDDLQPEDEQRCPPCEAVGSFEGVVHGDAEAGIGEDDDENE